MATLRLSTVSLMLSIVLWGTLLGGIVIKEEFDRLPGCMRVSDYAPY